MKIVQLVLRVLMWIAVGSKLTTMAGVAAARRSPDADGEEIALLLLAVPAEIAARLEGVGIAAGALLAMTSDDWDEKVLAGGLSAGMSVLVLDRLMNEYGHGY
ncbi:hypothetical protein [Actinosynnema sp. ALI-1.44]|uniref:hypothetical protein n=1 Tax=Actinosynnema sp. ALI-1.44 TaxID=1933779 RepID=UPI00117767D9|nr:hypothetical protein [Actinosynnema sp. ALI-1.44]